MIVTKLKNKYEHFIYWTSTAQGLVRTGSDTGYYVLSYPKSGSNWLCNLLSVYFSIPVLEAWKERWPTTKKRIYHLHRFLPVRTKDNQTIYIVRDGRDVVVSYFFEMIRTPFSSRMRQRFSEYVGFQVKEEHIGRVLAEFIDFLREHKAASTSYEKHLLRAADHRLFTIKFEDLRSDTPRELSKIIQKLANEDIDIERVRFAIDSQSIERVRTAKNAHFVRKGSSGDWRRYFNRHAAVKFWSYYGEVMEKYGYEKSDNWINELPDAVVKN
jgi:hypothetical protein